MSRADEDPTERGDGLLPGEDLTDLTAAVAPAARRKQASLPPETTPLPAPMPGDEPGAVRASPGPASPRTASQRVDAALHSHPTQQLPASRALPAADTGDSRMSTSTSPVAALLEDEFERMQLFLKLVIGATLVGALLITIAPGDPFAKMVVYGGCAVVGFGALFLLWYVGAPARYTPNRIALGALLIAVGAWAGIYYWGLASPAAAIYIYGIYVFAQGANFRLILAMYLVCAGLHAAFAVAVLTGLTLDRGVVSIESFELTQQISIIGIVQGLIFLAFITARASRKRTLEAVGRLEKAVRSVSQREAMLAEVRQELDRALKVGGPGRYSEQVVGSFKLGMLIGRGGMGEVYEAVNLRDSSPAAVKLLHPATLSDPHQVQRFLREAEVAAKLVSPGVVQVLEVGTTSGEVPFIAMERLRGFDLAHHLRRQRTLGLPQVVALIQQLAIGLEAARAAGIVHRDLKPHNLFLAERDGQLSWKILDFGVSKLEHNQGTLTQGHVVGTPAYMAPEQARGENVDYRADVYALAAIVYRSVTGHPAFTGKDVPSTLYDVVYKQPTQPSQLAQLPADLDRVLAIGLAKNPAERFQSATEFAQALAAAAAGELPQPLRRRAEDLLGKFPWGVRL
ncbi:MAG: protein kinase [Kofleriaceae bacterium]|nr:protein kinase [Kofleriaceae bacterium]